MQSNLANTEPREETPRSAVILNANAKRVTPRVRRAVEKVASNSDIYYTQSLEEADAVTERVANLRYLTVITGGGDGTVANTINQVLRHIDIAGGDYPRFGVLRLGTGNGVADFLGARDFRRDLREIGDAETRRIDLIQIGDRRATFAGIGWDAHIINNYQRIKNNAGNWLSRKFMGSVLGYLYAGVIRTVPMLFLKRPTYGVKVINRGGIGFRLDYLGNVVERFAPGAVVFDGEVDLACLGTTPYFGFKFKIMPFAAKTPGMFHLRLANMNPLTGVANLRGAWNGVLKARGITDLQLSAAEMIFDRPTPFEIAGDAAGYREHIEVSIANRPLECFTF